MSNVIVELRTFSGVPNSTFALDDAEAADLAERVSQAMVGEGSPAAEEEGRLGYTGFDVTCDPPMPGLPASLTVFAGTIVVLTPADATAFADTTGCEDALISAARNHGLGDILDAFEVSGGNV